MRNHHVVAGHDNTLGPDLVRPAIIDVRDEYLAIEVARMPDVHDGAIESNPGAVRGLVQFRVVEP